MKRYKVFMTQPAANDLQGISDYIANELREPAIAKKQGCNGDGGQDTVWKARLD